MLYFDPKIQTTPQLGQPVLYDSGNNNVVAVPWAGNHPHGLRLVSEDEGQSILDNRKKDVESKILRKIQGGMQPNSRTLQAMREEVELVGNWKQELEQGTGRFQINSDFLNKFLPDAPTPSAEYFKPEFVKEFVDKNGHLPFASAQEEADWRKTMSARGEDVSGFQTQSNVEEIAPGQFVPKGTQAALPKATEQPLAVAGVEAPTLPQMNLKPGDQGEDVQQLQEYLVSQGFMTQAEMDTGPGIYGPRTKAAVEKMQDSLGVDKSSGPGFFGPKTRAAMQSTVAPEEPGAPLVSGATEEDQIFENLIADSALSEDEKKLAQSLYEAISTNDEELIQQLQEGILAGTKFSDPYFKAKARIAVDALERGLQAGEADLQFEEQQLANTLADLREDVAAGKDLLSLEERQELKALDRKFESNLEDLRTNLAAAGLTSSSVRAKKEQILGEETGELRESTQRRFAEEGRVLGARETRGERDVSAEVARLRELTERGAIKDLRGAEEFLGSEALGKLPGLVGGRETLGGLPGTLEQERARDALGFAQNFVF